MYQYYIAFDTLEFMRQSTTLLGLLPGYVPLSECKEQTQKNPKY